MRQRQIKLPAIATWVERRAQRREVRKRWEKLQIAGLDLGGGEDLCRVTALQLWRDFRVTLPVNPESGTSVPYLQTAAMHNHCSGRRTLLPVPAGCLRSASDQRRTGDLSGARRLLKSLPSGWCSAVLAFLARSFAKAFSLVGRISNVTEAGAPQKGPGRGFPYKNQDGDA